MREAARYDALLADVDDPFARGTLGGLPDYDSTADLGGGIIGYIAIPDIGTIEPVFHGTSDETLLAGVGHLEGSSLPSGGGSVRSVLVGHSGISKRIFDDLEQMSVGDSFYVVCGGVVYDYVVRDVAVIEPYDTDCLRIEDGLNLCSLVTCTPRGTTNHRLVVTGELRGILYDGEVARLTDGAAVSDDGIRMAAVLQSVGTVSAEVTLEFPAVLLSMGILAIVCVVLLSDGKISSRTRAMASLANDVHL